MSNVSAVDLNLVVDNLDGNSEAKINAMMAFKSSIQLRDITSASSSTISVVFQISPDGNKEVEEVVFDFVQSRYDDLIIFLNRNNLGHLLV